MVVSQLLFPLISQRRILSAPCHELRSPLTRTKPTTAMQHDVKQPEEIEQELGEMELRIEELRGVERLDAGHNGSNRLAHL